MDEHSETAVGDSGPWVRHLGLAWRTVADPRGRFPVPEVRHGDGMEHHDSQIARWSPVMHLLVHGLGWTRVDLGLARWLELGRPVEDPVLALVDRWCGEEVLDLLAWASRTRALAELGDHLCQVAPHRRAVAGDLDRQGPWAGRGQAAHWADGDQLHLGFHALTPLQVPEGGFEVLQHGALSEDPASPRAVTVLGGYAGWATTLPHYGKQVHSGGRSWRTDVVVLPLGWLGTYRWSRETGGWFRGRHRWHVLGA